MVEIDLIYEGNLKNKAIHGPSQTTLLTDAPKDNEGEGSTFSPTDLVATALASCMTTLMGIVGRRHDIDLTGIRGKIKKHMTQTTPRRIAKLEIDFEIPQKIEEKHQKMLERAALSCPVHQSLNPEIEIRTTFHWK